MPCRHINNLKNFIIQYNIRRHHRSSLQTFRWSSLRLLTPPVGVHSSKLNNKITDLNGFSTKARFGDIDSPHSNARIPSYPQLHP